MKKLVNGFTGCNEKIQRLQSAGIDAPNIGDYNSREYMDESHIERYADNAIEMYNYSTKCPLRLVSKMGSDGKMVNFLIDNPNYNKEKI